MQVLVLLLVFVLVSILVTCLSLSECGLRLYFAYGVQLRLFVAICKQGILFF